MKIYTAGESGVTTLIGSYPFEICYLTTLNGINLTQFFFK